MPETVIRLTDAPRFGDDGTEITGYASPTRGSDSVSAWKVLLQPGAGSPVHRLSTGEAFIALAGQVGSSSTGARTSCVPVMPSACLRASRSGSSTPRMSHLRPCAAWLRAGWARSETGSLSRLPGPQ